MLKIMSRKLGTNAIQEIKELIGRCTDSKEISAEAARLAALHQVGKQRIYSLTKNERAMIPDVKARKRRADRGRRAIDVKTNKNWKIVNGWIGLYDYDPAEAYITARERGLDLGISFETFMRYRRELQLSKKQSRVESLHRRFEASAPGEIFQFDISGLKERWFDTKTRRIIKVDSLDVSRNHPNTLKNRVPVWRFALIDDFSRRVFIRYYAVHKGNSSHVVEFLLLAYSEMGVPLVLYTDNDSVIKYRRMPPATKILDKALADQGGYRQLFHKPGNARATGKIERFHQKSEKYEKAIGLYIAERGPITVAELNERLALGIMQRCNNEVHRSTGMTPNARWQSKLHKVRRVDYPVLHSALMVDDFPAKIWPDLTIKVKSQTFQLPTGEVLSNGEKNPFISWGLSGKKINVVFPDDLPFFTVVDEDLNEYDIPKDLAAADVAGDWQATAEPTAQKLKKEYKAAAKADAEKKRNAGKEQADIAPIPIFEELPAVAAEDGNIRQFPKPEILIGAEEVAAAAPGRGHLLGGAYIDFWEAERIFRSRFPGRPECKAFLDALFSAREGIKLPQPDIEAAIDSYVDAAASSPARATGTDGPRRLKAV